MKVVTFFLLPPPISLCLPFLLLFLLFFFPPPLIPSRLPPPLRPFPSPVVIKGRHWERRKGIRVLFYLSLLVTLLSSSFSFPLATLLSQEGEMKSGEARERERGKMARLLFFLSYSPSFYVTLFPSSFFQLTFSSTNVKHE